MCGRLQHACPRRRSSSARPKGLPRTRTRIAMKASSLRRAAPLKASEANPSWGGSGYLLGNPKDFDRAHALDGVQLFAFLSATQPESFKKLAMVNAADTKDINRLKFLTRLSSEIGKRGVID